MSETLPPPEPHCPRDRVPHHKRVIYWKAWSADGNNVFEGNMVVDKISKSFEWRYELEQLVRTHLELTKNGIAIKQVVICNIMDI